MVGGLFFGTNYILSHPQKANTSLKALLPSIKAPVSFDLELSSPDNQIISFQSSVIVSGTTSPNTPLIISNDSGDFEIDSDTQGLFSKAVSLGSGLNHITITAFDPSGNKKEITREVYFSKEQL